MNNRYLIFLPFVAIGACTDDQNGDRATGEQQEHVWQEQTQAIDKAKEVDQLIQDAAQQQRQAIDESSQ